MKTQIEQVGDGVYRISTLVPNLPITFNQFLIDDEQPALIHTGTFPMYERVREAIGQVLDPSRLRYIIVPHFESDECGGMGRFVTASPQAQLVCSEVGAMVNLSLWDYSGPIQGVRDGSRIDLGRYKLRFLETPHVHHWDSMMVFEETTRSLFPADLFLQPGEQPAIVRENLGREMCQFYTEIGIFASEIPVRTVVDRIEKLDPQWIHPMHGGSLPKEIIPDYIRTLRNEPFAYDGRLFGRPIG